MKSHLENLCWKITAILVACGVISAVPLARADNAGQKAVAETRQALRQQGFKTDLADFDFSTSPELRAREAILKTTVPDRRSEPFVNHPNLMEAMGTNSAVVVWKLDSLKKQYRSWPDNSDQFAWEDYREAINANQPQIDAAGAAILSGPIRFNLDARGGNGILLPHLAMLKNLTQMLGSRTVLDLHDGNLAVAWTNLMAATRLVTAWEPEPAEISHLVRFGDTTLVFNAIWQALQTNGWPDEQLARLQTEWQSADFFTHLPETAAFKRASDVAFCQQDGQGHLNSRPNPGPTLTEFVKEGLRFPPLIWSELNRRWNEANYRKYGSADDEKALLLFYRDRELELRNAVQAPTWAQMRQLPGVTNVIPFQSKYHSRMQSMLNMHAISMRFQREGSSLLGRAAKAEAQRRLIITALALERYRGKHGSYPNTLTELAPEFLKNPPVDFMDGQLLRYRPTDDGHFVLYSVGLDGVDDGGQMPSRERSRPTDFSPGSFGPPPKGDIIWPLPASSAAVQDLRRQEARTEELHNFREQQRESEAEWKQSPLRRSRVAQIMATNWLPVLDDGFFGGRPATEFLRNAASANNRLSLAELMTPHQVLTGNEPEDLTFEFPVSYDAITNHGFFYCWTPIWIRVRCSRPTAGQKFRNAAALRTEIACWSGTRFMTRPANMRCKWN